MYLGEDNLLLFKPSIRMEKKRDSSDFEHGMVVDARRAVWVFKKNADLLRFSCTTLTSLRFIENGPKKRKYPVRQLCGQKSLVDVRGQRRMGRLVRDDRKATVTQIITRYNQGCRTSSLNTQHVKPWSSSCQLRTGNRGFNSHRLTKIGQ